jgi:hypothetical protein
MTSTLPSGVKAQPTRFIMVTCRSLSASESKTLSKNFKNIVLYDNNLHSANTDLTKFTFDLLLINPCNKDNHLYMEIISSQAKQLNIPFIVVKRKLSNYKLLVESLSAYIVSKIPSDLESNGLINFLLKEKLPKLDNQCFNFIKSAVKWIKN